nr:MAG TPA: hypothetical protein [Caudoviricetes sp.]
MSLKINNLIESLKEKYGELEVDGEYGEQCKPGDFLEKLLETIYSFTFPSREWESSKRALAAKKEEEIWTKQKNH